MRRAIQLIEDAERKLEGAEDDLSDAKDELRDEQYETNRLRERLHADAVGHLTVVAAGRTSDDLLMAAVRAGDVVVLTGDPISIDRALRLYGATVTLLLADGTS